MKKYLFVAAAATLALSSCSDNEIVSKAVKPGTTPISVSVYSQGQTRYTETTSTVLQRDANGFKLWAVYTDQNDQTQTLIDGAVTTYSNGAWTYAGEQVYWPTNESTPVSFYGIYPAPSEFSPSTPDLLVDNYTSLTDIVVAYSEQALSDNKNDGEVALTFKHILSDVSVTAKGEDASYSYLIKSITLTMESPIYYNVTGGEYGPADGTDTDITYPIAANGVNIPQSTATAIPVGDAILLPALASKIAVAYTVTDANGDGQDYEKYAELSPLAAGKKNVINLTLPYAPTAMTFSVTVEPWTAADASSTQTPELD